MDKKQISLNQLTTWMILFLMGGAVLTNAVRHSKQDAWLVLLIAGVVGLLLMTIYHRISKLHNYSHSFRCAQGTKQ